MPGIATKARSRLRTMARSPRLLGLALRLGAGRLLPEEYRGRFIAGGADYFDVCRVLTRLRGAPQWAVVWRELGEEKERLARQAEDEGRCATAVELWLGASTAYYFAQFIDFDDPARKAENYARCANAYAWAAHRLNPPAERVEIPFGAITMPGYLRRPAGSRAAPVVVNLNGVNSAKEEFRLWEDKVLARGLASLSFDGPGFGETWERMAMPVDFERVGTAVAEFLLRREDVDSSRLGIFGPSLGGLLGLRIAAHEQRFRALVALCPPYDVAPYWERMSPAVRRAIAHVMKLEGEPLRRAVVRGGVRGLVAKVRCPLLVVGAGRDSVVPGDEARRVHAEAAGEKTLWFFPEAEHLCLGVPNLLADTADWLAGELGTQRKRR